MDKSAAEKEGRLSRRKLLASIGAAGAAALVCSTAFGTERKAGGADGTKHAGQPSMAAGGTTTAEYAPYDQVDLVKTLQDSNEAAATLYAKVTGDRCLEVLVPFKGSRCAHYALRKDAHDDFIKLENGAVSVLETVRTPVSAIDYANLRNPVKLFETFQPWSNKEFALNVTPAGSGYSPQWIPEHNGVGTVFAVSQQVYFDEAEVTDWTPDPSVKEVKSVKVAQHLLGKHPNDPDHPLAELFTLHTVTAKGVFVKTKITWLRPVTIAQGYGMMFPAVGTFAGKLVTSCGNAYDATAADGSATDLAENDRAISYAYVHTADGTNGEPDTVLAMTIHDIAGTLRYGQSGRRSGGSVVWLQHRDANTQKLYPQIFDQYTAEAGESYEAGGTFVIGELPLASRLFV